MRSINKFGHRFFKVAEIKQDSENIKLTVSIVWKYVLILRLMSTQRSL